MLACWLWLSSGGGCRCGLRVGRASRMVLHAWPLAACGTACTRQAALTAARSGASADVDSWRCDRLRHCTHPCSNAQTQDTLREHTLSLDTAGHSVMHASASPAAAVAGCGSATRAAAAAASAESHTASLTAVSEGSMLRCSAGVAVAACARGVGRAQANRVAGGSGATVGCNRTQESTLDTHQQHQST